MTKQISISLYTSSEDKSLITTASGLVGLDYSAFCRMASLEKARHILKLNSVEVIPQNS